MNTKSKKCCICGRECVGFENDVARKEFEKERICKVCRDEISKEEEIFKNGG